MNENSVISSMTLSNIKIYMGFWKWVSFFVKYTANACNRRLLQVYKYGPLRVSGLFLWNIEPMNVIENLFRYIYMAL